jgi:uncharacterized protein
MSKKPHSKQQTPGSPHTVTMPEVDAVVKHPIYQKYYERLVDRESTRRFCCHQIDHTISTARIAYIYTLERGLPFRKEVVYAAGLLHDIGKVCQYDDKTPHEQAGAHIAEEILADVDGFTEREKATIVQGILEHRHWNEDASQLGKLLYEADKASRTCYLCPVREACSWSYERMNLGVGI